jgi:hypothetical protein
MRKDLHDTPFGNLVWFIGVIEDMNDPLKANRMRVRCFGFNSENKAEVPTDSLPWASVVNTGLAASAPNFVNGDWVIGFFLDGKKAQSPVIFGMFTGIPSSSSDPSKGFNDPNGVYPKEVGVPTNSRLARNDLSSENPITLSRDSAKKGVQTASGNWDEPTSAYNAVYPNNHVIETAGGHFVEIDDTSGAERIHVYHRSGTFVEMYPDGKTVFRSKGSSTEVIYGDNNIYVSGDCNISADGNVNLLSKKSTNIQTDGDVDWKVGGKFSLQVAGSSKLQAKGIELDSSSGFAVKSQSASFDATSLSLKATGSIDINAGGKLSFASATVSASRGARPLLA